jgi:type I restriction enzyme S subunit
MIKGSEAPSRARQIVNKGDILFSTVRPYLRNIAVVDEGDDENIASTGFLILRPISEMIGPYLFNVVRSPTFLQYIEKFYRGANYPAVNESDILNSEIPLPPDNKLINFSHFVYEIDNKISTQKNCVNVIDSLNEQLFFQLFTGELVI